MCDVEAIIIDLEQSSRCCRCSQARRLVKGETKYESSFYCNRDAYIVRHCHPDNCNVQLLRVCSKAQQNCVKKDV